MTHSELVKDIIANNNGSALLTVSDVARYIGKGRDGTREFLSGMGYLRVLRQKRFHAHDIAAALLEEQGIYTGGS